MCRIIHLYIYIACRAILKMQLQTVDKGHESYCWINNKTIVPPNQNSHYYQALMLLLRLHPSITLTVTDNHRQRCRLPVLVRFVALLFQRERVKSGRYEVCPV